MTSRRSLKVKAENSRPSNSDVALGVTIYMTGLELLARFSEVDGREEMDFITSFKYVPFL